MKAVAKKGPRYITDKKGKKLSVVISLIEYNKILEELEELEDIRLYDAVKARNEKSVPLTQYLQHRKKKHA